jgi:uncharacterized protein (DUF58 family)
MEKVKKIIKKVKHLEITSKKLVDGLICGNYHSIFKGQGIEFNEIRQYYPGDDFRTIDWKVTARYDYPYVKNFIEERDQRIYFLVDVSSSSFFGNVVAKKEKAIEFAATLMFAAYKNNDNVGLLLYSNKIEKFIFARKGKKHVLKIISNLVQYKAENKGTSLKSALNYFSKVVKKRSIIFIISDFFTSNFEKSIKHLRNKHDIIAVNIFDKRELEMPNVGLIELEDFETGEQILVDTSSNEFRLNYKKEINKQISRIKKIFLKSKIDVIHINTDESFNLPLKKFFKLRKNRIIR